MEYLKRIFTEDIKVGLASSWKVLGWLFTSLVIRAHLWQEGRLPEQASLCGKMLWREEKYHRLPHARSLPYPPLQNLC